MVRREVALAVDQLPGVLACAILWCCERRVSPSHDQCDRRDPRVERLNRIARHLMNIGTLAPQDPYLRGLVRSAAPVDPEYEQFVYQWGLPYLDDRPEMVGFTGASRVLDAGCGLGNWTLALARHNREVVAVDSQAGMRERTRHTCDAAGCGNVEVLPGLLENCGFEENQFDLIWCSLLLEYVDREKMMSNFSRWLKPGGRIYVSTNAEGRWVVKMLAGIADLNWQLASISFRTLVKGEQRGRVPNFLAKNRAAQHCEAIGLDLVGVAAEGCLDLRDVTEQRERPMFPKRLFGVLDQNIEFVARKPISDSRTDAN